MLQYLTPLFLGLEKYILRLGEWEDDNYEGYGRLAHKNGDIYEGELKQHVANGQGTYTYKDGASYRYR